MTTQRHRTTERHRTTQRHRAVVFDMGGVLVELGPLTDILGDEPLPSEVFWSKWLASPTVRDFEMGRCSAADFGERLVDELGLTFGGPELVERFVSWPRGLFAESSQLVADLISFSGGELELAMLSNTNDLHWRHQTDSEAIRGLFDRHYLSYELGLAKPDVEIFEHVVADLGCPAGEIVFLDDNQVNVDGACSAGIDAVLVRGPVEARRALVERDLVR